MYTTGPIIRLTPDELHIGDPEFFTDFLAKQGPQSKYDALSGRFNMETSTFNTAAHDLHKRRRGALENMFSRQQVCQLVPILLEKAAKMLAHFRDSQISGQCLNLLNAYMAITEDMMFEYGFGMCEDKLDRPGFEGILHPAFISASRASALLLHFPSIAKFLNSLPDAFLINLNPDLGSLVRVRQVCASNCTPSRAFAYAILGAGIGSQFYLVL